MLQEFSSLEALVEFDFHQMRSLDNSRASDVALEQFHYLFHSFFNQFPKVPDLPILQTYVMYMSKITEKINEAEYEFFLAKYLQDQKELPPELIENMARLTKLKSYKTIPTRMQYWAAGSFFGNTIRYPLEHRKTVSYLQDWADEIEAQCLAAALN